MTRNAGKFNIAVIVVVLIVLVLAVSAVAWYGSSKKAEEVQSYEKALEDWDRTLQERAKQGQTTATPAPARGM